MHEVRYIPGGGAPLHNAVEDLVEKTVGCPRRYVLC